MSSIFPVSIHSSAVTEVSTRRPRSSRPLIASAISSSPRALGFCAAITSNTPGRNAYTPMTARSVGGSLGFSMTRASRSPSITATPNARGSGTRRNTTPPSAPDSSNARTNPAIPPTSTLSPRYRTNESSPTNSRQISAPCAIPAGESCRTYVNRAPNRSPSPISARICASVSPTTIAMSRIPASTSCRIGKCSTGMLATGTSCFAPEYVNGRNRLPLPPERTMPFMARDYRYARY